ncbi:MAG TPA: hypothetical protein EYP49_16625 [Anaerolineae bacterium]|nr:hypothetical protein [Anaerolineae bacterium]
MHSASATSCGSWPAAKARNTSNWRGVSRSTTARQRACSVWSSQRVCHLAFTIPRAYIDYTEAEGLSVPSASPDQGLVLSGKLPLWLWTALALTYQDAPWLAVYQPRWGEQAIVVGSPHPRTATGTPGSVAPVQPGGNVERHQPSYIAQKPTINQPGNKKSQPSPGL